MAAWHASKTPKAPHVLHLGRAPPAQRGQVQSGELCMRKCVWVSPEFPEFVVFLLSSDAFAALASKTVREGSKMPRADWEFLLKSGFRRPSETVLGLFSDAVKPICGQLRNLALYNQQLAQARDPLLPRLMNGGVAV